MQARCQMRANAGLAVGIGVNSRQQLEGGLMPWADDAEVATIEGCHFSGVEALGRGDHRGIDGA